MLDLFRPAPAKPQTCRTHTQLQRQSKRVPVPVFDIPIRVEMLASGVRYPCHLWDVSEHGACLLLRSSVQPGQPVMLRIHAPCSGETVAIEAKLIWLDQVMGTYYAGVQYSYPLDFGPTFLGPLLRNAETLSRTPHLVA